MFRPILIATLLLFSCGHAQVDDASQLILDYFDTQTANALASSANTVPERIDTMLYTMTMYSASYGENTTEITTAIDRPNRRIGMESQTSMIFEDSEMDNSFFLVYDDGAFTGVASDSLGGLEEFSFDRLTQNSLREQYEAMFTLLDDPVEPEFSYAQYDGRRAYADVLEGIQISVDKDDILALMPTMADMDISEVKMVLTDQLEIAATVMTLEGQIIISKFNQPSFLMNGTVIDMSVYSFNEAEDSAELMSSALIEYKAFNEPLDDSLFILPQVSAGN